MEKFCFIEKGKGIKVKHPDRPFVGVHSKGKNQSIYIGSNARSTLDLRDGDTIGYATSGDVVYIYRCDPLDSVGYSVMKDGTVSLPPRAARLDGGEYFLGRPTAVHGKSLFPLIPMEQWDAKS